MESTPDNPRRSAPATQRNREPILSVLKRVLPEAGRVLEIASGTGEHALYFSSQLLGLQWQPTDGDKDALASIAAWTGGGDAGDLLAPLALDVTSEPWPVTSADAVVCINMIHISPWSATEALMRGAGRVLPEGGVLYLYGPYKVEGAHTSPSNADFEGWLKDRNPEWGVRDLEAVCDVAAAHGLELSERIEMPANNLSVIFSRTSDSL